MHSRLNELLRFIGDQTAELRAAYDSVPAERRGVRPTPARWSAAEIVHHVALVERRVTMRLRGLIEQARAAGEERDESPILTQLSTARMMARTRRFVTSEPTEPRDTSLDNVWTEFDDTRRALTETISSGDGLALGAVSAQHPALGDLTAYGWIAFVGAHAGRHAAQIREDALPVG